MKATQILKYASILVCLPFIGMAQQPTSYDSDGDGVPDSIDNCLLVKGKADLHGCPFAKEITATDRDGDGVPDADDACLYLFGVKENKGCPVLTTAAEFTAGSNVGSTPAVASSGSMFTTTSASEKDGQGDFKDKMSMVLSSAGVMFVSLRGNMYQGDNTKFIATECLPEAKECYITAGKTPVYIALFGMFTDGQAVMKKSAEIKKMLIASLPEKDWEHLSRNNGVVEEYKLSRKQNGHDTSVAVHVDKDGKLYKLYVQVEAHSAQVASNGK